MFLFPRLCIFPSSDSCSSQPLGVVVGALAGPLDAHCAGAFAGALSLTDDVLAADVVDSVVAAGVVVGGAAWPLIPVL